MALHLNAKGSVKLLNEYIASGFTSEEGIFKTIVKVEIC